MDVMQPGSGDNWLVLRDGDDREHFVPVASVADVFFQTTDEGQPTANVVTTGPGGHSPFTITVLDAEAEGLYQRLRELAGRGAAPFPGSGGSE